MRVFPIDKERASELVSFWRENEIAVVILLRVFGLSLKRR